MTLEEIKDKYTKEHHYNNWDNFINDQPNWKVENIMDDIAERYAKERVNEALENLNLSIRYDDTGREGCTWGDTDFDSKSVEFGYNNAIEAVKESILKLKQK